MPRKTSSRKPAKFPKWPPKMRRVGFPDDRNYQGPPKSGDPEVVMLIERAIDGCYQIVATYDGLCRAFCPLAIGTFKRDRRVLGFQFEGQSGSNLPDGGALRCLRLDKLEGVELREGPWSQGDEDPARANCFDNIEKWATCSGAGQSTMRGQID